LNTLRTLVVEAQAEGTSGDALIEAVLPALRKTFGRWESFEYLAKENVRQVDAELSGTKKIPQVH
jgi:hypothetical protein